MYISRLFWTINPRIFFIQCVGTHPELLLGYPKGFLWNKPKKKCVIPVGDHIFFYYNLFIHIQEFSALGRFIPETQLSYTILFNQLLKCIYKIESFQSPELCQEFSLRLLQKFLLELLFIVLSKFLLDFLLQYIQNFHQESNLFWILIKNS